MSGPHHASGLCSSISLVGNRSIIGYAWGLEQAGLCWLWSGRRSAFWLGVARSVQYNHAHFSLPLPAGEETGDRGQKSHL